MRKKILKPKATFKECEVRIEVPCRKNVIIFEENIYSIKLIFELKKDKAKDLAEEWDFGRCVYLLQWAIDCKTKSVKIKNYWTKEGLEFRFVFENLENMTKFVKGIESNVNNLTCQEM